jgi:hypothetical protein
MRTTASGPRSRLGNRIACCDCRLVHIVDARVRAP